MNTNESKTIYTEDGTPIRWFASDTKSYLDKTTLIFGGTGSGKTTIIEEILYLTRKSIPNYIVIAPKTSDVAYRKKIPARCIKEDLSKERLEKIWKRQYFMTQLYNTANDVENLESLFLKAPDRQAIVMVKAIIQRANDTIITIESTPQFNFAQKKSQTIGIEELRNKKINMVYKKSIRQNKSILEGLTLTDKEKITLDYMDFNPRIMLIIDDCSEKFEMWMKYFKKGEVNPFESIFYKGRWNYITLVFAAHDDKIVDTKLRKNARVTFYANSSSLVASLNKTQSGYTSQEKKLAQKMAGTIFVGEDNDGVKNHQKFCYIREDTCPFRYMIANLYPEFSLGCNPLLDLTKKMPKTEDSLSDNPYIKNIVDTSSKPKKKRNPRYTSGRRSNNKYD
jgi:hypothetical protein